MKYRPTYRQVLLAPLLIAIACVGGCDDDGTGPGGTQINGTLVAYSECGGFDGVARVLADDIKSDQSAVAWEWDGKGTFKMRHINAAFNCCPNISCEITLEDHVITVLEMDEGMCECLCLTDADFQITGLRAGMYSIKFIEPYLIQGDLKIEFPVSLTSVPAADTFVVYRDHYPWMPSTPEIGTIVEFSACGGFEIDRMPSDPPEDSACVSWEYDDDHTLWLIHQNAVFNCGLYDMTTVISVDTGGIWIEEKALIDPMYCLCPFDIKMRIDNVQPELQVIYIVGSQSTGGEFAPTPDTVRFSIDLSAEESGYHCYDVATSLDY